MLDPNCFVRQLDATRACLMRRGLDAAFVQSAVDVIEAKRRAQHDKEALQQQQNEATAAIQREVKSGNKQALEQAKLDVKSLKARVQAATEAFAQKEIEAHERMLHVPNLPANDVPDGKSDTDNREIHRHGAPKEGRPQRAHFELGEALGVLDFERASKTSGPRFAYLIDKAARLERALANFLLDKAREAGFVEVSPPLLVRPSAMQAAGQYPKFIGESFETQDQTHVLVPTSEVPLVAMMQDEILPQEALPLRLTALTPCFRKEAGAAGRDTRGLVRQHQFFKVEIACFTTPEQSEQEHLLMRRHAESLLEALGLHYRTVHLCTGDMGFAAASTYDIEVWLPGQQTFREISSVSNCTDFQARRGLIRSRPGGKGGDAVHKPKLVHTLNGSALPLGRTLVAIFENYQRDDGRIDVPEALVPYMGGVSVIDEAAFR